MNVTILGCGRWGSFLAWYLDEIVKHNVCLWGRESSEQLKRLKETRCNDYVKLSESVNFSDSLCAALNFSEYILISIAGHNFGELMERIVRENYKSKTFILCMKGLEPNTGRRFSEVAEKYIDNEAEIAIWVGPGHPRKIFSGKPSCMIIDSKNNSTKFFLREQFKSKLIYILLGEDMIGNEIGAAAKNVLGIASGILEGLDYSDLRGVLMSRGTIEIGKLVRAIGGNEITPSGLCCLGDYEASLFSEESNSRNFGLSFINKKNFDKYAPGQHTTKPLVNLSKKYNVDMPIINIINQILLCEVPPKELLRVLVSDDAPYEFGNQRLDVV